MVERQDVASVSLPRQGLTELADQGGHGQSGNAEEERQECLAARITAKPRDLADGNGHRCAGHNQSRREREHVDHGR
jgi:hypothetical protein